ncbi:hypothetical protein B6N58_10615 [Legionella micdadei]|nr:hypothetical protein B6N58_10615 [Legionella micdadei]ARH01630.1 hypothetical protein B6V88_10840 [Legionella micdadei]
MRQIGLRKLFGCFIFLTASVCATEAVDPAKIELKQIENNLSNNSFEAYWVFSGIVTNESGEHYDYYFQIQRKNTQFHALATLIDSQSKDVLLFEEGNTTIDNADAKSWRVGKMFMQFNPINNSWVFGVKTHGNKGFNFKIDMLAQAVSPPVSQDLRSGVELLINQTGRLNGHLQTGETSKDQFVTAQKAWFKQIRVKKPQDSLHSLTGVLCQFNDGSGFYAVNLQEPDALRGAVAGWRDIQGSAIAMSQFVSVKETKQEGIWRIRIPSPNVHLTLQDALAKENGKHQLIAGVAEGNMPGFCAISRDQIG